MRYLPVLFLVCGCGLLTGPTGEQGKTGNEGTTGLVGPRGPQGPLGSNLYYDGFERQSLGENWLKSTHGSAEIDSGRLGITGSSGGFITLATPISLPALQNFEIEIDTEWSQGGNSFAYGIGFMHTTENAQYRFGISANGGFRFGLGNIAIEDWQPSDSINLNGVNRLGVIGIENSYDLYINGEWIASFSDDNYPSGGMFLYVSDLQTVMFDNLKVWQLSVTQLGKTQDGETDISTARELDLNRTGRAFR